jgi:non-canonical (house-cleaning) NTP pyrophosphatase
MYEKEFTQIMREVVEAQDIKSTYGEVFWLNNSAIPNNSYRQMAAGLSNEKVTFKGVLKSGVAELMAVHHRQSQSPYKLTSGMVGLVTDSVVRRQKQHDLYSAGVKNLLSVVSETFKQHTAKRL